VFTAEKAETELHVLWIHFFAYNLYLAKLVKKSNLKAFGDLELDNQLSLLLFHNKKVSGSVQSCDCETFQTFACFNVL
jgi:hypothetical protein